MKKDELVLQFPDKGTIPGDTVINVQMRMETLRNIKCNMHAMENLNNDLVITPSKKIGIGTTQPESKVSVCSTNKIVAELDKNNIVHITEGLTSDSYKEGLRTAIEALNEGCNYKLVLRGVPVASITSHGDVFIMVEGFYLITQTLEHVMKRFAKLPNDLTTTR